MRRRAAGWMIVVAVMAASGAAGEDPPFGVWIDKPVGGDSVFGLQEIELAVESQEPLTVEVLVDGETVALLQGRPFRVVHDFGYDNVGHTIEARARSASGRTARASVQTRPVAIDDQIDLNLQQLYVTVTSGDRRVLGLGKRSFRVFDSGDRQEIVTFERGDVPLTAVLLLDSSLSMMGMRLEAALRGAGMFVERMAPLDEAMIMLFSDRLLRATEFSSERAVLSSALAGVEAHGGTSLNDYLFVALKRLDARQGRRVVVLFSDGSDVHSVLPMQHVLRKAQISQALIYWIHLQDASEASSGGAPRYTTSWRGVDGNRQEFDLLRRAIEESGGRVRAVASLGELGEAFVEILAELREQYVLGYYPTVDRNDGTWHDVKVRVSEPGVSVRTRGGYIDY